MRSRPRPPSPSGRSMRRTNTARSSTTNVGTPKIPRSETACSCSSRIDLGRPAGVHLVENALGVHPGRSRAHRRPRPAHAGRALGRGGRRTGRGCTAGNCSGMRSRATTPAARATRSGWAAGSSHAGVPPSGTWAWLRKKGTKVTSQGSPGVEAGEHVLVAVSGEGTAVVPGNRKSTTSHVFDNARRPSHSYLPPGPVERRRVPSRVARVSARRAARRLRRPARWPCRPRRPRRDERADGRD